MSFSKNAFSLLVLTDFMLVCSFLIDLDVNISHILKLKFELVHKVSGSKL